MIDQSTAVLPSVTRIFECVQHWARVTPDSEAIVFQDRRLTYAELQAAIDRAARALLAAGTRPGDRVAMLAMACPEFMITFLAASQVGAMWLGLNPKLSARELSYILNDCRPKLLFTVDSYGGKSMAEELARVDLKGAGVDATVVMGQPWAGVRSYHEFTAASVHDLTSELAARAAQVQPDDDVLLMYTSGSTGQPKGVIQTHHSILVNVQQQARCFYMDRSTRSLLHFPINHVAADVEIGYATMFIGERWS
ncbi:MAG: acyl--CoA ligase [Pirellulaceae bacterium]|nr:acyl--CoA ligase [Pirellulaceae bacterium]